MSEAIPIPADGWRRVTRSVAREVECPECGAPRGGPCRLARPRRDGSDERTSVHEERLQAVRDEWARGHAENFDRIFGRDGPMT